MIFFLKPTAENRFESMDLPPSWPEILAKKGHGLLLLRQERPSQAVLPTPRACLLDLWAAGHQLARLGHIGPLVPQVVARTAQKNPLVVTNSLILNSAN